MNRRSGRHDQSETTGIRENHRDCADDTKKSMKRLKKFHELPDYLKDNEYILDHYRSEWPLKDVFLSVFSWHNETLNIWTHLGGFLIFLGLTVMSLMEKTELAGLISGVRADPSSIYRVQNSWPLMMRNDVNGSSGNSLYPVIPDSFLKHTLLNSSIFNSPNQVGLNESMEKWPWFVFLGGSMACLMCSSISHLLACHSKPFNLFFWRLDYAGISLMIVSSFFAPIYYAFSCHPFWRLLYLSSISLLGLLAVTTLLAPQLSSPRFRPFRAAVFLAMGFSGIIPATHVLILHWNHPKVLVALGYELAMAVLYASGAVFYVTRVPERWKPGAFDIAGHSHQIFHVFVVFGALAHTLATLLIMDFHNGPPSCGY